jgi:hypothetical protein
MSLRMIEAVKRLRVTPTQKLVLFCLADCHNGETNRCDPSVATLMEFSGLSNRAVSTAIQALKEANILSVSFIAGHRSVYQLHPPAPPQEVHNTPAGGSHLDTPAPAANAGGSRSKCGGVPQEVHNTPAGGSHEPELTRIQPEGTGTGAGKPPKVSKPKASKPDWRDWNRQKAEEANKIAIPLLAPPEFAEAWTRYRAYRTNRAVDDARISSEAILWSSDAAEAAVRSCERHADAQGWSAVVSQIDTAISGRWQGLNFQHAKPYNGQQPRRGFSTAAAKVPYAGKDLSKF